VKLCRFYERLGTGLRATMAKIIEVVTILNRQARQEKADVRYLI
jgi:hypothetical protein